MMILKWNGSKCLLTTIESTDKSNKFINFAPRCNREIDQALKKILILFGILDIITLIRSTRQISEMYNGLTGPFWSVALGNMVMYSSLLFSGCFLIRQKQIGIWITYGQFPLRIIYQIMSFGFLWGLLGYFSNADAAPYYLSMTLLILEVIRLLATIVIHKKLQ